MRKIQCEVGVAYGSPGGQWDTTYVLIPAVAEEQIEAFAIKKAKAQLRDRDVSGLFLYSYHDYEDDD